MRKRALVIENNRRVWIKTNKKFASFSLSKKKVGNVCFVYCAKIVDALMDFGKRSVFIFSSDKEETC
jgi:hypothetical protein